MKGDILNKWKNTIKMLELIFYNVTQKLIRAFYWSTTSFPIILHCKVTGQLLEKFRRIINKRIWVYESQIIWNISFLLCGLTGYDWARQTFWPVKFSPPLFFLKIYLSYAKKLGSVKKKTCPPGQLGGPNRGQSPQNGKI